MTALQVESSTPGRLRLRVPPSHRDADDLRRLEASLREREGVEGVTTNHRTGSVLVTGSDDAAILDDLDEIGNVLSFGMGGAEVEGIAGQLATTIRRLNGRLYEATGENYHLGTIVPGAMATVGVWQTIRTGLGLELIPGPLMLWLAWDLYRTFGQRPAGEPTHAR